MEARITLFSIVVAIILVIRKYLIEHIELREKNKKGILEKMLEQAKFNIRIVKERNKKRK